MTCVHWWLLEPPNGPGPVAATCRACGAERKFRPQYQETWRDTNAAAAQKRAYLKATMVT